MVALTVPSPGAPEKSGTARPKTLGNAAKAPGAVPGGSVPAPSAPAASAPAKSAAVQLEPVCAALEPVALRTEMARTLGGGKKTVIVPAREDEVLGLTHFSKEEFNAAGLDWEQFMTKAAAAATRVLDTMTPQVTRDADGSIALITLRSDAPFAASVVLSPELLPRFQDQLGDRLVALLPDRNTVYLFSRNFGKFQDFGPRVLKEHAAALYPCSSEAFEISRDGLKCLGSFDDGDESASVPVQPPVKPSAAPGKTTPSPGSGATASPAERSALKSK